VYIGLQRWEVSSHRKPHKMSEEAATEFTPEPKVAAWLQALEGDDSGPCGADLEYDSEVQDLEKAAAGKAETQFSQAEPPQWPLVRETAESVMQRTRDLRIAMHWCRASVNLEGFAALPQVLCLLQGLCDGFWEHLHPLPDPDDGDTFARVGALSGLDKLEGLLGDVRQSLLVNDRRLGGLRVRDVEIALERLAPRADEEVRSQGQIQGALQDLPEAAEALRRQTTEGLFWLKRLQSVMNDRLGVTEGVDLKALRGMLTAVQAVLPAVAEVVEDVAVDGDGEPGAPAPRRGGGGVSSVDTRAEAIRAIELVCAYLERSEPTNPAQLLLRRAAKLIDKNFLQLMRELAPEAVAEVARIMGVDPSDIDAGSRSD
jgi:type VI secretion system protein ImpA